MKLNRVAKFFASAASAQQLFIKSQAYQTYRDGDNSEIASLNQQIDELQKVINGLNLFIWHNGSDHVIQASERSASRSRNELVRWLSDLHLEMLDSDVYSAQQVYAARQFVRHHSQMTISLFEPEPQPGLIGN